MHFFRFYGYFAYIRMKRGGCSIMKIDKMPPETRDAKCRAILSTKSLITLIAQDLLPEYQGYFRKEIETFIEQGLDTKDRIIGLNNENGITQKDIVFFMKIL